MVGSGRWETTCKCLFAKRNHKRRGEGDFLAEGRKELPSLLNLPPTSPQPILEK
jgi:hypothetical protein